MVNDSRHTLIARGATAETLAGLLTSDTIEATGTIETHDWQGRDGRDRYVTTITCNSVRLLCR